MAGPNSRHLSSLPEPRARFGLRLRIWLGCLGGLAVAGLGLGWVLLASPGGGGLRSLALPLAEAMGAGLFAGILLALWLDRGIVSRLRRVGEGIASGQIRGPGKGWGELAELSDTVQALLTRHRQLARAADELQVAQRQIADLWDAIDRWAASERWEALGIEEGPLRSLAESLNRGFSREGQVREQNREAARQVRTDLQATIDEARGAAEQSEHGFVEATAMLTTIYELQRLAAELQQSLAGPSAAESEAGAKAYEQWRVAAAGAIEELVRASSESVERLGAGLERVEEIGEQVQTLSNRAILLALNVVLAGGKPEAGSTGAAPGELKQLAREVRGATDRVAELSQQVTEQVRAANDRMRGIRERVALRLEQAPIPPALGESGPSPETARLLARMREMVQDAARKGERLSAAGEGASRAVQDLLRQLDEQAQDLEGLVVRLSPAGDGGGAAAASPERPADAAPAGNLRLLHREQPGDEAAGDDREERS